MKILRIIAIVFGITVLLIQLLNVDYDNLFSWQTNKTHFTGIVVCILAIISFSLNKRKEQTKV